MSDLNVFGQFSDEFVIEEVDVDVFNVASIDIIVRRQLPPELDRFTLTLAPVLPIPCRGLKWRIAKGMQEFRFHYEGVHPLTFDFAESQVEFELDFTLQEVGLDAFPRWSSLKKKYGLSVVDGQITCPEKMPGNPTLNNPMFGQETFDVTGIIWQKSYVSRNLPTSHYRNINCIDAPEGGMGQEAPGLPDGANWKLVACPGQFRGNIWRLSKRWLASGPNGWLRDIYGSNPIAALG